MLTLEYEDDNIFKVAPINNLYFGGYDMSYEKVSQAKDVIVGTKQAVKALKAGQVTEVVIAEDADPKVTANVLQTAIDLNVPYTKVDSMKKLGKSCGIDVGAAAVAIIQ
ncbi:hypothetical protein ANABIO32_21930 [Rossellomorea marisflavi]|jgi:large subunit ribosomal protein L7A|nr:hypothetical protein ANABIO32_21930 [Rossellomorea marisflavi]